MSEGNGFAVDGMAPSPLAPSEYVDFKIGDKPVRVPVLSLWDLDRAREPILALDVGLWWADYAKRVCEIINLLCPEYGSAESLMRACSVAEARALSASWAELLNKSGFVAPGEAEAAVENPGTGTLTPSSPNSEQEASAAEIPGS